MGKDSSQEKSGTGPAGTKKWSSNSSEGSSNVPGREADGGAKEELPFPPASSDMEEDGRRCGSPGKAGVYTWLLMLMLLKLLFCFSHLLRCSAGGGKSLCVLMSPLSNSRAAKHRLADVLILARLLSTSNARVHRSVSEPRLMEPRMWL